MISVYPTGKSKSFVFTFNDENDVAKPPATASYSLFDELDNPIVNGAALTVSPSQKQITVITTSTDNTLVDQKRGFRRLQFNFQDTQGNDYEYSQQYVLESSGVVEIGLNSFASYGSLILAAQNLPELESFHEATISDQRAALINAWYNIGNVSLKNLELDAEYASNELTSELLTQLASVKYEKLKRSQIIEADFLLGGNPIEDRRRLGLISDSSGESAQFFRTSRPVELPICKAAANALKGLVSWNYTITR